MNLDVPVKIKLKDQMIEGKLLEAVEILNQSFWWIEYYLNGSRNVEVFAEEDILKWNPTNTHECTCGSHKTNQPGHSSWCKIIRGW